MTILFYYFLIINLFGFVQIAYDKEQAVKAKRRIPERTLLGIVFLGGTLGSGIGMLFFRHKTAKKSYLWKFWCIVILQIFLLYLGYHFDILNNKIQIIPFINHFKTSFRIGFGESGRNLNFSTFIPFEFVSS